MTKKPKILLVDDDILFSQSLKDILSLKGYDVHWVPTANDALKILDDDYDVYIVDLNLPDKPGIEVIEEVKNKKSPPPVTIILTGFSSLQTAKKAISLKADAYLEKPIEPDRLFLVLAQIFQEKEKEKNELAPFYEIIKNLEIPAALLKSEKIIAHNQYLKNDLTFNKKEVNIDNKVYRPLLIPLQKEYSLIFLIDISDKEILIENYKTIFSNLPFKIFLVNENFQIFGEDDFCYKKFKNSSYPCHLLGEFCPLLQAKTTGNLVKAMKLIENRHWEENCLPLKDKSFLLFYLDRTQELEKTKELYLAKQEWERTFNAIQDSVIIIDKNFNIIKANKATYQFFKKAKLENKKCYEIFHQTKEPIINCPFLKTLRTKLSFTEEVEINEKTFLISVSPFFDEQGEVFGCAHIARDISSLKIIEENLRKKTQELTILNEQLKNSQRELIKTAERLAHANEELTKLSNAKTEFIQILSHEMRTPLTAILEGSALLWESSLSEGDKKIVKIIRNNAQKLFELINDLLDLTKIESGQVELIPKDVDIQKIISELIDNLRVIVEEKGLKLIKDIEENLPLVFVDEKAFYRVIVNLVSNAVKYSKENGEIVIRAVSLPKEKEVIVSVKDNGIGIPKEEQYKIFQKFAQIAHPGYQSVSGTGLGLALCKELVERSGGKIWFESEEHRGTTFYFTLPIYEEELDFQFYKERELKKAKELNFSLGIFYLKKNNTDFDEREIKIFSNFANEYLGNLSLIKKFARKLVAMTIGKEKDLEEKFKNLKKILTKTFTDVTIDFEYEKDFNN